MPTTTKYSARTENPTIGAMSADADDIDTILDAAWKLNRYYEDAVQIWDNKDDETGEPRLLGRLTLEWEDD